MEEATGEENSGKTERKEAGPVAKTRRIEGNVAMLRYISQLEKTKDKGGERDGLIPTKFQTIVGLSKYS